MLALGRSGYAALGARVPLHRLLIGGSGAAAVLYVVCALAQSPLLGVLACGLTGLCVSLLWPGAIILASRRIPSAGAAMFALLSAGGASPKTSSGDTASISTTMSMRSSSGPEMRDRYRCTSCGVQRQGRVREP